MPARSCRLLVADAVAGAVAMPLLDFPLHTDYDLEIVGLLPPTASPGPVR